MKKEKNPQKEILKTLKRIENEQSLQYERICNVNEQLDVFNYRRLKFRPFSMENQRIYLLIIATAITIKYLLS